MAQEVHQRLRTHLRDRIGDSLRGIYHYGPNSKRIVHLRADVSTSLSEEQASELVAFLRDRQDLQQFHDRVELDVDLQCNTHCFSDQVWLHFPLGPETGTVVTVDPAVARDLSEFVTECRRLLDGD